MMARLCRPAIDRQDSRQVVVDHEPFYLSRIQRLRVAAVAHPT